MSIIEESLYSQANINESISEESAEDIIMTLIAEYCDFDFEDKKQEQKALEFVDKLMNVVKSFNK